MQNDIQNLLGCEASHLKENLEEKLAAAESAGIKRSKTNPLNDIPLFSQKLQENTNLVIV